MSRMSLPELESALWGAAQLLRGKINATGYKEYVFPLVFFKRISDVHEEEYRRALELSGGDEDFARQDDNFTFRIPPGCLWDDVRAVSENVGQALVAAWTRIERANPDRVVGGRTVEGLGGIFGKRDHWTNKNVLGDATLSALVEHFSALDLSLASCPADEMGRAYEYLVGKFADDAGNTAQEFYTNRTVVELMTEILGPRAGESIYDPTCGTGGMLISCIARCKRDDGNWREIRAFGQEQNALTASVARMNLFLHGVEEFRIVNDDTLLRPGFLDAGRLRTFDVVLANPPYSIKKWNREFFANDPYGRNFLGTPPQGRADYAFIQHILKSMNPKTGRCAILLPHGVLFREEERAIREKLVDSDLLEAVIGLGPNLFYNSPMEACVVICRAKKSASARGRILFINAVNEVTRKNAESKLEPRHIDKILKAWRERTSDGSFAYDASNDEIAANDWSLAISLYAHDKANSCGSTKKRNLGEDLNAYSQSATEAESLLAGLGATITGCEAEPISKMSPFHPATNLPQGKDGWRIVKFAEIAINSVAKKSPTPEDVSHYIGLEHIDPGTFTVSRWGGDVAPIGDKLVMKKGDILFGRRRAYQRKVAIAPFDGIFSAHGMVLRPKTDVVDARFFPFFIASDQFMNEAVRISVGGLSPTINWKTLKECEFTLPPISHQRALADLLWAANDLKEAYRKAITATDEMLKAKFREMFGTSKPDEMKWKHKKASSVFEISSSRRVLKNDWRPNGVPFLRVRDMVALANGEELQNEFFVSQEYYDSLSDSDGKVQQGDILVSATSTIGKCYVVKVGESFYFKDADILRFRKRVEIDSEYFIYSMQMPTMRDQIIRTVGGTTVGHFLICKAKEIDIPLPPLSLQREFVAIAEKADKTKAALKKSIADLDQVMKGLINE